MSALASRLAGAPITWGVCEVPGWGHRMAAERVLAEAAGLELRALERGPAGFLPDEPGELVRLLEAHGLRLVAGFVALVLHRRERRAEALAAAGAAAHALAAAGAELMVLAADAEVAGYERPVGPTEPEREELISGLERVHAVATEHGVAVALHPHYGTVIERPQHIEFVLEHSAVPLCLDTGHVLLGGGDPVELVRRAAGRVKHVHLKDVSAAVAERLWGGELGYRDAVAQGLYRPLGCGDVAIGSVVELLEAAGYGGWYVLEQDTVLEREPAPGAGPVEAAALSLRFLEEVVLA